MREHCEIGNSFKDKKGNGMDVLIHLAQVKLNDAFKSCFMKQNYRKHSFYLEIKSEKFKNIT